MKKNDVLAILAASSLVLAILGVVAWFQWYQSGIQVNVYERQGIHVTQWEVLMGAKPAVKVVP